MHVAYRTATRLGFPGMSRICSMLSSVPARPAPGRQMSRISSSSQNDNNGNNNCSNNRRDDSSNLILISLILVDLSTKT